MCQDFFSKFTKHKIAKFLLVRSARKRPFLMCIYALKKKVAQ